MMQARYDNRRGWCVTNEKGDYWWVSFLPRPGRNAEVFIINKHGKDMDPRNQHGQAVLKAVQDALTRRAS